MYIYTLRILLNDGFQLLFLIYPIGNNSKKKLKSDAAVLSKFPSFFFFSLLTSVFVYV